MNAWGTPEDIAAACGVPRNTARAWAKRATVPVACCVRTRRVLLWWPAAFDRARSDVATRPSRAA